MRRLGVRLFLAIAIQFATHFIFFNIIFWALLSVFLKFDIILVASYGIFFTGISIALEWLLGPTLLSRKLEPEWIEGRDDILVSNMVKEIATQASVKLGRVGIIDVEAPNAIAYAFIMGRPNIILTKGLLSNLTYSEVRAVIAYMMGCSRSGVLSVVTTFSGLLSLFYGRAEGYIGKRIRKESPSFTDFLIAGMCYFGYALTFPQKIIVSRLMSVYSDEFSVLHTEDSSKFISALLKVSTFLANDPMDPIRVSYAPLKGLMFQDPTIAIRDKPDLERFEEKYGIDVSRLLGAFKFDSGSEDEVKYHIFEKFWSHPGVVDRLEHVLDFGKKIQPSVRFGQSIINPPRARENGCKKEKMI